VKANCGSQIVRRAKKEVGKTLLVYFHLLPNDDVDVEGGFKEEGRSSLSSLTVTHFPKGYK